MSIISLTLISVGLAMDAFAVSVTEGLALKKLTARNIIRVAFVFGAFQALMPFVGWHIGGMFSEHLERFSDIISFVLLAGIGCKMLYDGYLDDKCENEGVCQVKSNIMMLGVATSIDALAIGFSFSLVEEVNILLSIVVIGVITFIISSVGVYLGHKANGVISYKAEYLGGGILVLMGLKPLIALF